MSTALGGFDKVTAVQRNGPGRHGARVDPAGDGHLSVVQPSAGCVARGRPRIACESVDGVRCSAAAVAVTVPVLFVTANCPIEARSLGIGCLAKPYSDKVLRNALEAVEPLLGGPGGEGSPPDGPGTASGEEVRT